MTPGIGLALLAMIGFGAGDLIYKRAAAAGIEARHFIMLQAWFFCPLVTIYAVIRQKLVLEPAALWGSLAGLVMFFAFYNFSRSLRTGSISTNAPIFRLSFTLTAALAIGLLHEPLTLAKFAGLGLALVAVLALASSARFYLVMTVGERIVSDLRADVFAHLTKLEPAFFDSSRAGDLVSRQALLLEAEGDVGFDIEMRKQRVALEHHVDGAPVRRHAGHIDPVEQDAAGARALEPGDQP